MEDSHYDEFGNYIGPALSDSDVVSPDPAAQHSQACSTCHRHRAAWEAVGTEWEAGVGLAVGSWHCQQQAWCRPPRGLLCCGGWPDMNPSTDGNMQQQQQSSFNNSRNSCALLSCSALQ